MRAPQYEWDVFLSYSTNDRAVVEDLARRLQRDGKRVWIDEWAIEPGDPIGQRIQDALARSRTVLVCMSASARLSDWVAAELQAVSFRDPLNRARRFIPVKLDDTDMPAALAPFKAVDWRRRSDAEYRKLLRALTPGALTGLHRHFVSEPPPHGVPMIDPRHHSSAFVLACIGLLLAALSGAWFGGALGALLAPIPLLAMVLALRHRIFARYSGHSRARTISLVAVYGTSALYLLPSHGLSQAAAWVVPEGLVAAPDPLAFNAIAAALAGGVLMAANAVMYRRDISLAAFNPDVAWSENVRRDFPPTVGRYCTSLIAHLNDYDGQVNWSDHELTPLEAQVEVERSTRLRPRIARDLVDAIRRDRSSQVFVVLGDPGSGKSVSLRRLVRDLCRQAADTGVIPLYCNLREFPPDQDVTVESLADFVRESASRQASRDADALLATYYEPFRLSGRLFLVIDSFDELPAVLDSDERSELHKRVSATFDRLFTQEFQGCRAVLASRNFRAPVGVKGTRLVIRPFSERQIRRAMRTWLQGRGVDTVQYVHKLFRNRPHLVPALRNPFTAELIAQFARRSGGEKLPDSLFEMFDQYLSERFTKGRGSVARDLSPDDLRKAAAVIALGMYDTRDVGLEAPVERVVAILQGSFGDKAMAAIEALRYTRIARMGGHDRRQFSFAHRRFAEFFVVEAIRSTQRDIQTESIPTDSRWRDCLVMYCGIAEASVKREIAAYCWRVIVDDFEHIRSGRIDEGRKAIHCSRFLADAFRSDREALEPFATELGPLVVALIGSPDLLAAKIGAEMIPLLEGRQQQEAIVQAFRTESAWVCDTALDACRHLATIDDDAHAAIGQYLQSLRSTELLARYDDLRFSLSLSDAFRPERRALRLDTLELVFLIATASTLLVVMTVYLGRFAIVLAILCLGISAALDSVSRTPRTRPHPLGKWIGRDGLDLGLRAFVGMALGTLMAPLTRDSFLRSFIPGVTVYLWPLASGGVRLLASPAERRRFSARSARMAAWALLGAASLGGAFWLVPRAWSMLPEIVRTGLIWTGGAALALTMMYGLIAALKEDGIPAIVRLFHEAQDRARMKRIGLPEAVTSDGVYQTVLSYRTPRTRRLYLDAVCHRRIRLIGRPTDPPIELLADKQVAEALARLREQWLGLAV